MSGAATDTQTVDPVLRGYLVEFDDPDALLTAAETVRDAGYTRWDTYTPFPVHGIDRAMGIKSTRLPLIVFGGGLTGAILGYLLQWWTNAIDYPFLISGKPFNGIPDKIPVIFELTILLAAFGTFFGMLALNRLPRFYHPLFRSERFARVTDDRFFVAVDSDDPKFDEKETLELMESLGGMHVEAIDE